MNERREMYRRALGEPTTEQALVASGGLCAPMALLYGLPNRELGVVRDSVLNGTNDYRSFWETFEIPGFKP